MIRQIQRLLKVSCENTGFFCVSFCCSSIAPNILFLPYLMLFVYCYTPLAKRNEIFTSVDKRIHGLFESQLQALREYYGRSYESLLNDLEEKYNIDLDNMDEEEVKVQREKMNTELADAAKRSSKFFVNFNIYSQQLCVMSVPDYSSLLSLSYTMIHS